MTSNTTINITSQKDGTFQMSNNTITLADIVDMIAEAVVAKIGDTNGTGPKETASKASKKAPTKTKAKVEEPEEDEDDEEEEEAEGGLDARIAELKKVNIRTLRKQALALGFDEDEVNDADKDTLAESIAEAEAEDADTEPDDDEDEEPEADEDETEEEDEEESEYDRDELEALTLTKVKTVAKEAGYGAADLKGLDKDAIIDLILGEGDDEEEDEDDEEELTEENLREMSLAELKALCKDFGITVPRGAKADTLIDLLLEEEDED